jgi:hypothetical protein
MKSLLGFLVGLRSGRKESVALLLEEAALFVASINRKPFLFGCIGIERDGDGVALEEVRPPRCLYASKTAVVSANAATNFEACGSPSSCFLCNSSAITALVNSRDSNSFSKSGCRRIHSYRYCATDKPLAATFLVSSRGRHALLPLGHPCEESRAPQQGTARSVARISRCLARIFPVPPAPALLDKFLIGPKGL